jgi:tetratricopeptide (TPR) repeat protein
MDYPGYCREAVTLLGSAPQRYAQMKAQMIKVGREREAMPQLVEAMEITAGEYPDNPHALRLMGDLLFAAGRPGEALPYYRRADLAHKSAVCLVEFGLKLIQAGQLELAREALSEAREVAGNDLERNVASHSLATVERRLGNVDTARELLAGVLASDPEPWLRMNAELELGRIILFNQNRPAEALPYYESFVAASDPKSFGGDALFELARLYMAVDRPADAESLLEKAVRSPAPDTLKERAGLELTEITFFKGDFRAALAGYRRFVRRNPGSEFANDALRRMRTIRAGLDGKGDALNKIAEAERLRYVFCADDARMMLESAVEEGTAAGLTGFMVLALTDIYLDEDRTGTARDLLEWFVADAPDDHLTPEATFRLASIYSEKLNDTVRARSLLQGLILRSPDSPHAARARAEIELLPDIMP